MTEAPDRRSELLERIIDHVVEHGIDGLTLRGLSQTTGSNNRMLLYYFGSRDQLIVTALQQSTRRFPKVMAVPQLVADASVPLCERLDAAWRSLAAPENLAFHRLFFQVFGLAAFDPASYQGFLDEVGMQWLDDLTVSIEREGFDLDAARRTAGQVLSLWRGFQVALLSGIDPERVDRAAFDSHQRLVREVPAARD
ncbi:TetR/AcrR family transcriptional regulator [Aeromicrobium sp. IC_218]|uniref:TetR/AcrR family transcriptional regulator n=1 Tax=Aeromicrobium sp. IC_218 TaxID=2545468 RepID=UPI00103C098A|nr:TetR/AcrR family transcriptional regulator [Aeromicrobium sp. IC_218]TCI98699.1 TetR/AcrR family transcriptional regulator [Aeromicrobium sp. IC_218]